MLKRVLIVLALLTSLSLVAVLGRGRVPEEMGAPARPHLRPWELLGCYELRLDPWEVSPYEAAPDSIPLPTPGRVMLMPDSIDEWGRPQRTRRAVPLEAREGEDARYGGNPLADILRWFARADTLWLVWSDGITRAGIALFDNGDHLFGQARLYNARDSIDLTAHATGWRINCATLDRESGSRHPRR